MSFSGKYIAKMFSMKKFFGKWMYFVRVVGNQGYVSYKVLSLKNLWTDWYWYGLSSRFFNTMHEIDTAAQMYLEPF